MLEEISSSTSAVMSGTGQEVARLLHQTPETEDRRRDVPR